MDLNSAMFVSAAGMKAQGARLRVIAENLANSNSTAETPGGDPYRRKVVSFKSELDRSRGVEAVAVDRVQEDRSDFIRRYEPAHPNADDQGYVSYPNINPLIEVMDMREAQRTYEANLNAIETSRGMLMKTIDLLRG